MILALSPTSTLDYFHRKEEIASSLVELSRVIKPGGTLVITMDTKNNIAELLFRTVYCC